MSLVGGMERTLWLEGEVVRLGLELRLAEEGLANATQEKQQLEARITAANAEIQKLHAAWAEALQGVADRNNDLTACQLERDRLNAALKRYGRHRVSCPIAEVFTPPEGQAFECNCGFEKACSSTPQPEKP